MAESSGLIYHCGGCHCGKVRFEVQTHRILECIDCNCSICRKKQNIHFIVPEANFKLLKGEECLSCYTFNTHKAKHYFCKVCGVQSFYKPRSNPDGYGVMPHCLDDNATIEVHIRKFDGRNWEQCMEAQRSDIQNMSKVWSS